MCEMGVVSVARVVGMLVCILRWGDCFDGWLDIMLLGMWHSTLHWDDRFDGLRGGLLGFWLGMSLLRLRRLLI